MVTGQSKNGVSDTDTPAGTQETGGTSGSAMADQAKQATDQVRQKASQVTDQAKQVASSAQSTVSSQFEQRKGQLTQVLDSASQSLGQMSDQLRQNNQQAGDLADMAAGQIQNLSGYIKDRGLSDLVSDIEGVARRQPELFLAGAFVVGLLGARFLKSSSGDAYKYSRGQLGNSDRVFRGSYAANSSGPATRYSTPASGAPFGVYDPGSKGIQVREIPQ